MSRKNISDIDRTLCWECGKACNRGCNWSDNLEPVEGWIAEPTKISGSIDGFLVRDCPEFVREPCVRDPERIDTGGMMKLLEAFVKQMRMDYVNTKEPGERRSIEAFLRGRGKDLLQIEPDAVIRGLRKMIRIPK